MLTKPVDVFDRDSEWADLTEFSTSTLPGLRIAVVYGRRRQGKSYLLRRLTQAAGGLYHLATEQLEAISVRRFTTALAHWAELPPEALAFSDWETALLSATKLLENRAKTTGRPALLVLDEFPYLAHATPGLPSIIQNLYDNFGPGSMSDQPPLRLILCGSAISIMAELLSGTKALRGRGALELRIKPLNYRDARMYWNIENLQTAFFHNALIGGTPGYRDLVIDPTVPDDSEKMSQWITRNVLRPTAPLFDEANRVIHEDPRIHNTAIYASLIAAISSGETAPTKIGGLLGRGSSSLTYQLGMLESAGFIERHQDLLLDRRPVITIADPIVRLHHLVIEPYLAQLEAGQALQVWQEVQHLIESKILGPHFEKIATEWVIRYARDEVGLEVGATGQATVACREHKTSHEIDILGLRRGTRPHTPKAGIAFIGEAKSRERRPGMAELRRLEHIRDVLSAAGYVTSEAVFGLFSTRGFTEELTTTAVSSNGKVILADLKQLYGVV